MISQENKRRHERRLEIIYIYIIFYNLMSYTLHISNNESLKYQRFPPSDCKAIGIRK